MGKSLIALACRICSKFKTDLEKISHKLNCYLSYMTYQQFKLYIAVSIQVA